MKTCLINQSCGLGDILLSIKIGCIYAQQGYSVIWPVEPVYKNIHEKIKPKEQINFVCVDAKYDHQQQFNNLCQSEISNVTEYGDFLYVPIRRSFHSLWGTSMQRFDSHDASNMISKFVMCNTSHNNWQDFFDLNRDFHKEEDLKRYLGAEGDYHFVNKMFGTPPRWREELEKEISTPDSMKRIEMEFIEGFDIFDWLGVYEGAAKIDSVSTSTFYFFEKLNLKCVPTIYSRNTSHRSYEENFSWLERLSKKKYNFIC